MINSNGLRCNFYGKMGYVEDNAEKTPNSDTIFAKSLEVIVDDEEATFGYIPYKMNQGLRVHA